VSRDAGTPATSARSPRRSRARATRGGSPPPVRPRRPRASPTCRVHERDAARAGHAPQPARVGRPGRGNPADVTRCDIRPASGHGARICRAGVAGSRRPSCAGPDVARRRRPGCRGLGGRRGRAGRVPRSRGVALVHTNTSVTLGGAAVARWRDPHVVARARDLRGLRALVAGVPAFSCSTAQALPCVSRGSVRPVRRSAVRAGHPRRPGDPARRAPRAEARARSTSPPTRWSRRSSGASPAGRAGRARPRAGRSRRCATIPGSSRSSRRPWRGELRHQRELHELAARLGVASRLFDVGFRDDVNNVYGAADVVVVPSKQPDPLPNAALGGRGRGVLRRGERPRRLPEILRDRETGRLCAPGDPGALAACNRRACRGAAERERWCRRSRTFARRFAIRPDC